MCEIAQTVIMILMSGLSVWDILYQKFRKSIFLFILSLMIVCRLLAGKIYPMEMLLGAGIGLIFIGISKMTKEALGYADSLLIVTLGILLGIKKLLLVLWIAFSLAAVFSAIGLLLKKFSRQLAFPFLPFLTISYAGVVIFYG